MKIKMGMDEKIFNFVNYLLLAILAFVFLYPVIYVFSASFSNPYLLETGSVTFLPKGFTFNSFIAAFNKAGIWRAYGNSVYITLVGTIVNMLFTISGAYALSKPDLKYKKQLILFVIVTMWFDPGLIPVYLNFRDLGLIDSYNGLIFGFAISTFNVIILKGFFESIPRSFEESAKIDGASQFRILTYIYLPLSGSALTTVALFYAISRWNGYFWAMAILTKDEMAPLPVFLKKLVVDNDTSGEATQLVTPESLTSPQSVIYAVIVMSLVPILIVYPFIQKFFRKGVTLGGLKG